MAEQLICASAQAPGAAQLTAQAYVLGQSTTAFRQACQPMHSTWQSKPGGHAMVPWQLCALQVITQMLFGQPPVHSPGHGPPGGGGVVPQLTQLPLPSHWPPARR